MTDDFADEDTKVTLLRKLDGMERRFDERLDNHAKESRASSERVEGKVDSVRSDVQSIHNELFVGQKGRQPLIVRVQDVEGQVMRNARKLSPAAGMPAVAWPPPAPAPAPPDPTRQTMPSIDTSADVPTVAVGGHAIERWKLVVGLIATIVTTAGGVLTLWLSR